MNKDQQTGTVQNVKGRAKQAVGIVSGDKDKEAEGARERTAGAARKVVGNIKEKIAKKIEE